MSVLDMRPETTGDRLWFVTNEDGSHEIVADSERAGRAGFAPPYGKTYREILADILRSTECEAAGWLAFHQECGRGIHDIAGPLGGRMMRGVYFVADRKAYKAYTGTHHKGGFLGFGGALVTIFFDSGEAVESNNMWFVGTVPRHLRTLLPDTANIQWQR